MTDSLYPVWEVTLALSAEAEHELVAKQIIKQAEDQLERIPGVHVLGATVKRKDEPHAA